MLDSLFVILSAIVAVFGVGLAVYYAITIRKESMAEYNKRNQGMIKNEGKTPDQTNTKTTNPIKVFIYLDEDKMYSLSSQLFEGITNEILSGDSIVYGRGEMQRGEFASGSFMANMMFQHNTRSESRSLNDFAFTIFEDELLRRQMLYCVEQSDNLDTLRGKGLVKITGRISINDYSNTMFTLEHFNDVGKAVGSLQYGAQVTEKQLKDNGLILDASLKNNVKKLVSFGYKDRLEIVFSCDCNLLFSTTVNREFLKDSEDIFISRYSRLPEKQFTLVGIISQRGESRLSEPELSGNELKKNIRLINSKTAVLENSFNGRANNECIIDPIAIFTEIS